METVQKFMPYFQEMLQQWYQLTLHNQEYAIALVGSACLVTAIFYSIRIGFLKRSAAKILKAKQETQAGLDEAKQQLETLRQQLAEATEHKLAAEQTAQAELNRATSIELRLNKSNQQLAGSLVNLVDCFELNLHNLPTADAENLLSEHEAVIARVADRFQNEQQAKTQLQLSMHAETAKLAEKEMLISSLENRLDTQTQHLAKLELAVEKYEAAQKQLEQDKLQLAQELQNRQAEATRQQAYQKPAAAPVIQETIQAAVEHTPEPIEPVRSVEKLPETKAVEPDVKQEPTPVTPKPQAAVSEPAKAPVAKKTKPATGNKMKGLFGRVMDKVAKMDEKLGSPGSVNVEPEAAEVSEARVETPDVVEHTESVEPVAQVESSKQQSGLNDKFSGLFGGFKKSAAKPAKVKPEQETAAPAAEEAQVVAEKPDAGKEKKGAKQLSGLFGKFKAKK
ncbi:hypothetical protein [Methylomonas methanica]|uniref:Uncharacterized protein n=1 Tax=Methylomonas methanica (strain DSM 25384 / MC09) TaxID=857087 RepID=G0A1R0_METMM|nr:hypothetical protein [Methylomonas methanica]AEG00121.1 hypothetical protein Metme_1703 [Methylomonas methanica MC09]